MDDVVIDSSIFVAAFKENDPFHEQALETMGQIGVKYRALVSCLVPVEVVGVVARVIDSKHAERIRKKFIDWTKSGIIVLEELSKMRASDAQLIAIRHRLRGADAVVVQLAREKKCKLASFDKEILREFEKLKRQS